MYFSMQNQGFSMFCLILFLMIREMLFMNFFDDLFLEFEDKIIHRTKTVLYIDTFFYF